MIFSCLMNRIEICNFLLKEGTINLNFQSTQVIYSTFYSIFGFLF